jgi:radical S-adenosyl methionine domain-containing protein 2
MTAIAGRLPPTVNMHIVGHCNFGCLYCYARFEKAKKLLPLPAALHILDQLPSRGVTRVTFAGGEPTLHPALDAMLRGCADRHLVTSLVTNGSRLDRDACRRIFPWLRWLVLSVDSHVRETNDALGRRHRLETLGQNVRAEQVGRWVREWNALCPERDRVRLKINIVVTSLNAHEDPSAWITELRPERVKLLQCCIVPGENDDARHLACDAETFARYRARAVAAEATGVKIVAETSGDLVDSYAMIDPLGRFRQAHTEGYVESQPIADVGIDRAWEQVGGCNLERFRARGGEYDGGEPCRGFVASSF